MIRVVIVDDHAVVRSGLRLLLEGEEDIQVEDEGGSPDEAVWLARLYRPDVSGCDAQITRPSSW